MTNAVKTQTKHPPLKQYSQGEGATHDFHSEIRIQRGNLQITQT